MGTTLSHPIQSKLIQRRGDSSFRVGCVSMQGYRSAMEDSHTLLQYLNVAKKENNLQDGLQPTTPKPIDLMTENGATMESRPCFFGVFDGHNGDRASQFCKENMHRYLEEFCKELTAEQIKEAVLRADNDFMTKIPWRRYRESGSTSVFSIAQKETADEYKLIVANVGDSRCLLSRAGVSHVEELTNDHKPQNKEEFRRIKGAGGFVADERVNGDLALSRAIGDSPYKARVDLPATSQMVIATPDVRYATAKTGDFLLLCCDGLFEELTNQQVVDFVRARLQETDDLAAVMADLIDYSLKAGSTDNMTAMIIQFRDGTEYNAPDQFIPGPISSISSEFLNCYKQNCERYGFDFYELLAAIENAGTKTNGRMKSQARTRDHTNENGGRTIQKKNQEDAHSKLGNKRKSRGGDMIALTKQENMESSGSCSNEEIVEQDTPQSDCVPQRFAACGESHTDRTTDANTTATTTGDIHNAQAGLPLEKATVLQSL